MAPNLKPPTKPGKAATQKELAAYHSELRRYARTLEEWETKLQKMDKLLERKNELLKQKAEILETLEEDECFCEEGKCNIHPNQDGEHDEDDDFVGPEMLECGCSEYDARNGCECPECEQWRKKIGLDTDQLADMGVCEIDEYLEKRKKSPDGVKPMDDQEMKFFAQYEEQMKVKE
jgi:hypothetical protein